MNNYMTFVEHIRLVPGRTGVTINSPSAIYCLRVHFLTSRSFRVKHHLLFVRDSNP